MDEEKRDLPIPPKDLRRVPPPPPRINGEKNVAQSEENADENSENVANEEKENDASERCSAELNLADSPEKNRIGHADQLLEQQSEKNRSGILENRPARGVRQSGCRTRRMQTFV